MAAGTYDRRITIERATFANDAAGDPVPTWAFAFKLWARKRELGGSETQGAGSTLREMGVDWYVRDHSDARSIAPENHRIIWDGRIYEISAIHEDNEGRQRVRRITTASRPDQRGTLAQGVVSG